MCSSQIWQLPTHSQVNCVSCPQFYLSMSNDETNVVATSINGKFESLPASFSRRCIYRVPEYVRKGNQQCYRPFLVSIGPVYCQDTSLRAMKEYKLSFLRSFLEHGSNSYSLEHYIDLIRDRETCIRDCYEHEVSTIPSNEFTEMVLVDAAFVIYFFAMDDPTLPCGGYPFDENLRPMYCEIRRDLFLLENQLPFFALEDLFQEAFKDSIPSPSFRGIACDLIGEGLMPLPGKVTARKKEVIKRIEETPNVEHLVDIMRIFCLPSSLGFQNRKHAVLQFPPSVSKLRASGVKFVANGSKSLLDLTFAKGVLEMPTLVLSDFSESLFRSIMLFEQRHHYSNSYFIDYIHFLDKLIDTAEDVRILVQAGILENWLGSEEAVADLFNGISDHLSIEAAYFYYIDICGDLRVYSATRWNRWKAILRRNYFNHPWAIISVIYAAILLFLTVLQTLGSFTSSNK